MPITKLDQLLDAVKSKPKRRLVAAFANDAHTIEAVNEAREKGIIDATLVGDEAIIRKVLRRAEARTPPTSRSSTSPTTARPPPRPWSWSAAATPRSS